MFLLLLEDLNSTSYICEQVREIIDCRKREEQHVQLLFSPWTTTGAARAREQKEDMVRHAHTEPSHGFVDALVNPQYLFTHLLDVPRPATDLFLTQLKPHSH